MEVRGQGGVCVPAVMTAEAFEELVREVRPWVVRSCCRRVGDGVLAEDLAQEVLLRLHQYRGRLRAGEPLLPLLSVMVGRVVADHFRVARNREEPVESVVVAGVGVDPAAVVIERQAARRALRRLPARQREAWLLRQVGDLGYAEIAAALGVAEATVEQHLVRARKGVRDGRRLYDEGLLGLLPWPVVVAWRRVCARARRLEAETCRALSDVVQSAGHAALVVAVAVAVGVGGVGGQVAVERAGAAVLGAPVAVDGAAATAAGVAAPVDAGAPAAPTSLPAGASGGVGPPAVPVVGVGTAAAPGGVSAVEVSAEASRERGRAVVEDHSVVEVPGVEPVAMDGVSDVECGGVSGAVVCGAVDAAAAAGVVDPAGGG